MKIREMTSDDIGSVVDIDTTSFSMKWSGAEFENELSKDFARYFVAVENDEVIGFAGEWCVCGTADIEKIAVASEKRRSGAGSALLCSLIDGARQSGCNEVMLEVRAGNTAARNMYEKHGFAEIGRRKGYYDNGEDAVIMRLALDGVTEV